MKSQRKYDTKVLEESVNVTFGASIDLNSLLIPVALMFMAHKRVQQISDLPRLVLICNEISYQEFQTVEVSELEPEEKELFLNMEVLLDDSLAMGEAILTTQEVARLLSRGRKMSHWTRWNILKIDEFITLIEFNDNFMDDEVEEYEECDCEDCCASGDEDYYEEYFEDDDSSNFFVRKRSGARSKHFKIVRRGSRPGRRKNV